MVLYKWSTLPTTPTSPQATTTTMTTTLTGTPTTHDKTTPLLPPPSPYSSSKRPPKATHTHTATATANGESDTLTPSTCHLHALPLLLLAVVLAVATALSLQVATHSAPLSLHRLLSESRLPPWRFPIQLKGESSIFSNSNANLAPATAAQNPRRAAVTQGETKPKDNNNNIAANVPNIANTAAEKQKQNALLDNGIAPISLPTTSPQHALLESIRAQTEMTPRWPSHPRANIRTLQTYGPAYASIVISHALRAIYIPVFKAATTSTMWQIAYLENNAAILEAQAAADGSVMSLLHDMGSPAWANHTVYDLPATQLQALLDNPAYLTFGFVRNPYDRLVSAYVDKIARPSTTSYEYRRQMHSLFSSSDESTRRHYNTTKPSFTAFVHAVDAVLSRRRVGKGAFETGTTSDGYETNDSRRDLHWRPQTELLHPDLIHVDFVGRFETLEDDREVVLQWMYRRTTRRMSKPSRKKLHASDPGVKGVLFDVLRNNRVLKRIVQRVYKEDFKRFHYSTEVPYAS